jgi:uncharacterized protein YhaN
MSTGTADQLYLALRIAAIEDYLATPSPNRSSPTTCSSTSTTSARPRASRVLGELVKKKQVLCFTRQEHCWGSREKLWHIDQRRYAGCCRETAADTFGGRLTAPMPGYFS